MMHGPGKYDTLLTLAREGAGSTGAALVILDGDKGPGFSVQATPENMAKLPAILRVMADQIDADMMRYKA